MGGRGSAGFVDAGYVAVGDGGVVPEVVALFGSVCVEEEGGRRRGGSLAYVVGGVFVGFAVTVGYAMGSM